MIKTHSLSLKKQNSRLFLFNLIMLLLYIYLQSLVCSLFGLVEVFLRVSAVCILAPLFVHWAQLIPFGNSFRQDSVINR